MELGVTVEQSYDDSINSGRNDYSTSPYTDVTTDHEGILNFLRHKSKVTMDHTGKFHKVYTHFSTDLGFQ